MCGLKARPELNGMVVALQRRDEQSGRWVVCLDDGDQVRVLSNNLTFSKGHSFDDPGENSKIEVDSADGQLELF